MAEKIKKGFWETLTKSSQAFILALIIISSYVVFFAWIIISSPSVTNDNKVVIAINYDGMKDLTATFGIIAAAVVGYYFGQKNLEEAAKTAKTATEVAEQAKGVAKAKSIDLRNEKKNMIDEINKGLPIYQEIYEFISKAKKDPSKKVEDLGDVTKLKETIENRMNTLKDKSNDKKRQIENIESSEVDSKLS